MILTKALCKRSGPTTNRTPPNASSMPAQSQNPETSVGAERLLMVARTQQYMARGPRKTTRDNNNKEASPTSVREGIEETALFYIDMRGSAACQPATSGGVY